MSPFCHSRFWLVATMKRARCTTEPALGNAPSRAPTQQPRKPDAGTGNGVGANVERVAANAGRSRFLAALLGCEVSLGGAMHRGGSGAAAETTEGGSKHEGEHA
jgi:hypothetical protein